MRLVDHVKKMAEYNQWMNQKLFDLCQGLPAETLNENRGAFFGSISGTLNHLLVADTIWLKRFAENGISGLAAMEKTPRPDALDAILFADFSELKQRREEIDQLVVEFANQIRDEDLQKTIHYKNFKGIAASKTFFSLLMHLFNHQTHHRGQITTLLSQLGIDPGVTDLVVLIPDV